MPNTFQTQSNVLNFKKRKNINLSLFWTYSNQFSWKGFWNMLVKRSQ